jgi:hypothetical protein
MNTPAKARQIVYVLGLLLGGAATWAAVMGWGTYDPATGNFDLGPVHIPTLVGWIVSVGGNGLAAMALWRGWGK